MNNQMEMPFPEAPKHVAEATQEEVAEAREKYNILNKPLARHEDGKWYTTGFDGNWTDAEEYSRERGDLDTTEKGGRMDLK